MPGIHPNVGDVVVIAANPDPWTGCKVRIVELIEKWEDFEMYPGVPLKTYYGGKPVAACKVMVSSSKKPKFLKTATRVFLHKQLIPFRK